MSFEMACDAYMVNKSIINAEFERKKEFERRRKLRLMQVRQQAKDFSDKLRQTIQAETLKKRDAALKCRMKKIRDNKVEKMEHLKDVYGICLQTVGESHREAARQPDFQLLKEIDTAQKSKEAAARGVKARKKQLAEKNLLQQKMLAPIEQKRETRNRENIRSFFVSCLPKQSIEQKKLPRPLKKALPRSPEKVKNLQIVTEIPSNLTVLQSRSSHLNGEDTEVGQLSCPDKLGQENECSCDYLVCSCHCDRKVIRRRCHSESTVTSENTSDSKKPKLRCRSCSPQSVRTLNYCDVGNVYESIEPNLARVRQHPKDVKLERAAQNANDDLTSGTNNKISNKELIKKTEERSLKAVQREKLKKDFLQLLQDLKNVNREKLVARNKSKSKPKVYERERDIAIKHESKQKKLADAFETLLQTVKHSTKKNKDLLNKECRPSLDPSSPPTLNLATYHQINMDNCVQPCVKRRVISPEDEPVLTTPTVTCPPSSVLPEQPRYTHGNQYVEEEQYCRERQSLRRGNRSTRCVRNDERDYPTSCDQESDQFKPQKTPRTYYSPDSGTSYCSLPEHLTPSQKRLLDELINQVKKKGLNPNLKLYIQRLLNMSRESIENLPTSPRVDSPRCPPDVNLEESMKSVAELVNEYANRLNDLVNTFEVMENCASPMQHMSLPEYCYLDPPRQLPSPSPLQLEQTQLRSRDPLKSVTPTLCKRSVSPSTSHKSKSPPTPRSKSPAGVHQASDREISQPSPPEISLNKGTTPSHPAAHSSVQTLSSGKMGFQTPFGLSSNLLPNPKDLFQHQTAPQPTSQLTLNRTSDDIPESQVLNDPHSGTDSHDDSTSWAFTGIPCPPLRSPDAPPIDEKALFLERLGHIPGEGSNQPDLSNLTLEMEKISRKFEKLRAFKNNKDHFADDGEVLCQTNKAVRVDVGAQVVFDDVEFCSEDFQGNAVPMRYLQNRQQS